MSNQKSIPLERMLEIFFSLGAVPVILGALFKLTYSAPIGSPNTWLQVGLYTEAAVFLTYALVYILAPHKLSSSSVHNASQMAAPTVNVQNIGTVAAMENMLKAADITPESLSKLSEGFKVLETNIGKISAASSSIADTELYAKQIKDATASLQQINSFYSKLAETTSALANSAEDAKATQTEVAAMAKNLSKLNQMYSGMISAMQIKGS